MQFEEVCFVCTANMIRSVMAEAILTKLRPDLKVSSCGILAIDGLSPMTDTVSVIKENGYTVPSGKSNSITNCKFDSLSLVVCMTLNQKVAIEENYPVSNLHTLKELNGENGKDILDPVKLGITAYRSIFKIIEQEIRNFFIISD